jgi:signal transduction histidine kinase/response regulator of citrate/malate metabolism
MNPLTAVGLIAAGISTVLHLHKLRLAQTAAAVLVLIGTGKILEATVGSPGIDNLLFPSSMSTDVFGRGRMAPNTAVAFMLLGIASAATGPSRRWCVAAQVLSLCVGLIALFALVGYVFGVAPLHTILALRPMAIHTSIGLLVSALCLAGVQRTGFIDILRGNGPAGTMARSVLPIAVLIPIGIGGARLWGQQAGLYGTEVGISIQVVANVTLTCGLLIFAILMVHRSDKMRLDREAALRRSQKFAQVGHVRWGEADARPIWSEEVFRIHGIAAPSATPSLHAWTERVHQADRAGFREYLESACSSNVDQDWRGRIVRPDGEIRQVRVHLAKDKTDGQEHSSVFGIVSDVTELERARRQAEHAARAKTVFLANMSHEIRTPLNGVLGFSELLMEAQLPAENHEQAKMVHESAKALLELLNDILDLSKIEAGSLEVATEPSKLAVLLQQCVALVEPTARAKGIAIFLQIHKDVPDWALTDGVRLRQIALNLLGNAVKFTEKGFVALEVSRAERTGSDRLIIRVHDTGVGVSKDRQHAIFGDFVQADAGIARRFGGTGLGLSISRRLAELLGGSLTLESEPDRGTIVELDVPLLPVGSHDGAREKRSSPTTSSRRVRILLVEDVEVNQKLATAMLTKLGHEVELASNGIDAVQKMQNAEHSEPKFDLVFMDIQLPKLDGLEATRRIRKLGAYGQVVPIVGLSANAYASDVTACLDAGMNDHVAKPFNIGSLSGAVAQWCRDKSTDAHPSVDEATLAGLMPMFLHQCQAATDVLAMLTDALVEGSTLDVVYLASQVQQASHKLAGTAASFGWNELGMAATEADVCLSAFKVGEASKHLSGCLSNLRLQLAATLHHQASDAA